LPAAWISKSTCPSAGGTSDRPSWSVLYAWLGGGIEHRTCDLRCMFRTSDIQTGSPCQTSEDGHTTTRYCEISGGVHANDTLKRREPDTAVLDGLKEFLRHRIIGLGQVIELHPTRVTVSIKEAVEVVVVRLYCDSRYRGVVPRGCRSRGVPRTPRRGGPLGNSGTGPLGCGRADLVLVRRSSSSCARALSGGRHLRVRQIKGSLVL
jgi:hypothetical protein